MAAKKDTKQGISRRYARALFDLALEQNKIDVVEDNLTSLQKTISNSQELKKVFSSPVISKNSLGALVSEILAKINVCELVTKFYIVVAKNGRLSLASDIRNAFSILTEQHRGEVTAEIISAKELTKTQLDEIASICAKSVGKKIKISAKIDESIIGGLIVKIGSKMIDSSILSQLEKIKLHMKSA